MAELQAGKTLLREFFDIMQGKGRKLDEASLGKPAARTIDGFVARATTSTDIPTLSRVERTAIKTFTTDVLEQIKKANGGALTPQALIEAQQSYAMAAVRHFGDGPAATASLNQFKAAVREVMTEGFGADVAKVDRIAERTPRVGGMTGTAPPTPKPVAAPAPTRAGGTVTTTPAAPERIVAEEVVDAPAQTPPPRAAGSPPDVEVVDVETRRVDAAPAPAAAPSPAPAAPPARAADPPAAAPTPAWDPQAETDSRINASTALADSNKAVAAQQDILGIRTGMAIARGDASQGMQSFHAATTYEGKLAAFHRIDGLVDKDNKQVFAGLRRSGWISDYQSTYETGSRTSWVLTNHKAFKDGEDLFADPLHLKRLRDYVAAGSYDQKIPPVGVEALSETAEQVKAAKAAGKTLTDEQIDAGLQKWIAALKAELAANETAGLVTKLDKDGLRTNAAIEKMIENRSMTPLTFDTSVVQNAPGAWILPEEWTKLRGKLQTDLRGIELKEAIAGLRDHTKKLDTVDVDTEVMKLHFDKHRELARSPHLRESMPLTDSAQYQAKVDAETELAAREHRPVDPAKLPSGSAPPIRPAKDLFDDIYNGKLLSVDEINALEKHFRANKLQTEIKVQISGMRDLLKAEGTPEFKPDAIRTHLDAIRAIERRGDYQELTERSVSGKAFDKAQSDFASGAPGATQPAPRKVDDVLKDLFSGQKINKDELYQLELHYDAVKRATDYRVEVNNLRQMLFKEGTVDLVMDANHPRYVAGQSASVHDIFENLRKMELNENYRAHYDYSASAKAAMAETPPRARTAAEIRADLEANHRVSRDELLRLEDHYRAGYVRAQVSDTAERAVKFSADPTDRAQALKDFASGAIKFDGTQTLQEAMLNLGRRVEEAERLNPGAAAARPAAPRTIHEIVADIQSGDISASGGKPMSLADAKVFADRYKAYVSGEGQAFEAKQITEQLAGLFYPSNKPFVGIKQIPKDELIGTKSSPGYVMRLQQIMANPEYRLFMEVDKDALKGKARNNIDNILTSLTNGEPIGEPEVRRLREFFERWHNSDNKPRGIISTVTLSRAFDRTLGAPVAGPLAAGALATTLVVGGVGLGVSSALSGGSNGGAPTAGAPGQPGGATDGVGAILSGQPGAINPNLRAPNTVGGVVDRGLSAISGKLQSGTAGVVTFSEGAAQQDRSNAQVFIDEARTLGEKLKQRSPELAAENLDALALQVAQHMYSRYNDHKLTVGEAIDSYEAAVGAASPEIQAKLRPAVQALSADITAAGRRDVVVLPAPQPQN